MLTDHRFILAIPSPEIFGENPDMSGNQHCIYGMSVPIPQDGVPTGRRHLQRQGHRQRHPRGNNVRSKSAHVSCRSVTMNGRLCGVTS